MLTCCIFVVVTPRDNRARELVHGMISHLLDVIRSLESEDLCGIMKIYVDSYCDEGADYFVRLAFQTKNLNAIAMFSRIEKSRSFVIASLESEIKNRSWSFISKLLYLNLHRDIVSFIFENINEGDRRRMSLILLRNAKPNSFFFQMISILESITNSKIIFKTKNGIYLFLNSFLNF